MSKDYSKFKEKYLDSLDVDNVTGEQYIPSAIKETEEQIKSECNKIIAMGFQVEEHEDYSLLTKDGVVIRINWEGIHVLKGQNNWHENGTP